jgi:hypothetical protein
MGAKPWIDNLSGSVGTNLEGSADRKLMVTITEAISGLAGVVPAA